MATLSPSEWYRRLLSIRRFEERVLALFGAGELSGTTHCYIGQEAIAVGVMANLRDQDVVFSNHRCHGHYLARTGNAAGLLAEMLGRPGGVCGGRGGSQHLHDANFYTNGVLGSFMPITVGMALAEKRKRSGAIVVAFIGDGALGEGVVYESLNMAALYSVPLLIVLENNRYAQTTPIALNLAGSIETRFEAFGIEVSAIDSQDAVDVSRAAHHAIARVRDATRPAALVCQTYRFCAHSKGDDFRDAAEIEQYRASDPVAIAAARLSDAERRGVSEEVERALERAEREARAPRDPGDQ